MNEVIFTSSSGDTVVSVNVWDSKTGTSLMTYRGDEIINPKGLSILGSDYIIASMKSKPLLKVWPINSQQQLNSPRLLCPGKVSVVSCSPDGLYIALAVDEKLHIYQVSSGNLVGNGIGHFQPIKVIRWCCDGSIIASGGEDGMVTVWSLSVLLNKESQLNCNTEPRYIFSNHSLPVTDLIITSGGFSCFHSRLISVSSDRTCKIYDLAVGKLLLTIIFTEMLTAVSITPSEMEIFVGLSTGEINQFSLRNPKNLSSSEIHINSSLISGDNEIINVYTGHSKSITCLSTSLDGEKILSGSLDETVRIWHITSKQCLKMINLKGPVTNAFFIKQPKQMLEQDVKRNIMLCPFQKTNTLGDDNINEYCLQIITNNDLQSPYYDDDNFMSKQNYVTSNNDDSYEEIRRLRSINEQLYKINIEQLLQKRNNSNDYTDLKECNEVRQNISNHQKQPNLKIKRKKDKKKKKKVEVNITVEQEVGSFVKKELHCAKQKHDRNVKKKLAILSRMEV